MNRQHQPTHHRLVNTLSIAIAAVLLATACSNSKLGMQKYDDEDPALTEDDGGSDVPIIGDEECATVCVEATARFAVLAEGDNACTLDCGVDIGMGFDGEASLSILWSILDLDGDGDFQNGGSCDLTLECSTPCQSLFTECVELDIDDAEHTEACLEQFTECQVDEQCALAQDECLIQAGLTKDSCLDSGYAPDYCQDIYDDAATVCGCLYVACTAGDDGLECNEENLPALPPLPAQTGPTTWKIERAFLDAQLARIHGIENQVFLMPSLDSQKQIKGLEMQSIRRGDVLSSLGFRNGDVLRSINGHSFVGLQQKPWVIMDLMNAREIEVVIERRGQLRRHRYLVVK